MVETTTSDTTAECSYRKLRDFDWSMRLALSSDKSSGIQQPLLQLQLDIQAANGTMTERLIELDSEELNSLLSDLKAAEAVRDFFLQSFG